MAGIQTNLNTLAAVVDKTTLDWVIVLYYCDTDKYILLILIGPSMFSGHGTGIQTNTSAALVNNTTWDRAIVLCCSLSHGTLTSLLLSSWY